MKVKPTSLAPLFNAEIRRVAHNENKTDEKSMDAFMEEIAILCGLKQKRMVYHWRSGRHRLPGEHVPALCQRFGSRALLEALTTAAAGTEIDIPDNFNLALEANRSLREDLEFHAALLRHFEHDGIQPGELDELRELQARAHSNLHIMFGIAEADCARRLAVAEVRGQRSEVSRKTNVTAKRGTSPTVREGSITNQQSSAARKAAR